MSKDKTNALATVVEPTQSIQTIDPRAAVAARNLDDVRRMAASIAKSGLYGCKSIEEAEIRMVTGMELGLSMLQSIRGVFVISTGSKQTPGLYADMMVGVVKNRYDVCRYFRLVESTADVARYATHRIGEPEEVVMSFTMAEARQAGLAGKEVWKSYPAAMLRARASSALARAVYPDLLNGLYSTEELRDMGPDQAYEPTPDATATATVTVDLTKALDASIKAEQAKLYEQAGQMLAEARTNPAYLDACKWIQAHRAKLSAAQLESLRGLREEVLATLSGQLAPSTGTPESAPAGEPT